MGSLPSLIVVAGVAALCLDSAGCSGKEAERALDARTDVDANRPDANRPDANREDAPQDSGPLDLDEHTYRDETYLTTSGMDLKGDIVVPAGAGPFPAVIFVHGGAFIMGDKADNASWAGAVVEENFASFAINYRLVCGDTAGCSEAAAFPGAVADIKCAIMWLRANATAYRVDPDRISVFGSSAGGYFAEIVGTTADDATFEQECPGGVGYSNAVNGAVSYFGISDWNELQGQRSSTPDDPDGGLATPEVAFVGSECETAGDRAGVCASASPASHVEATDPPFFLLHSNDDPTIPVAQSRTMKSVLETASVPTEYLEVTGLGHGWYRSFGNPQAAEARDAVIAWLLTLP